MFGLTGLTFFGNTAQLNPFQVNTDLTGSGVGEELCDF